MSVFFVHSFHFINKINYQFYLGGFFFTFVCKKIFQASTPSGENTDRNPMSMLSASLESLDQLETREKYLQLTFESLSGVEMDAAPGTFSHFFF